MDSEHYLDKDEIAQRTPGGQVSVQTSVGQWCDLHYPGEDVRKKFLNLLEEVVELGCVLGVPAQEMVAWMASTIAKSDDPVGNRDCIIKEVGDVQLSTFNLGYTLRMDAMDCLEHVMVENRARSLQTSQARAEHKRALGMGGDVAEQSLSEQSLTGPGI